MMFPKQNMLSQYPQQLPTEINAIPVISQVPFPRFAVVTKMTKTILDSCQEAVGAPVVPPLWQSSHLSCPGM